MDRLCLHDKIEILRKELLKEYDKSFDQGGLNSKVINLSQRLDKLIVDCMKLNISNSKSNCSQNTNSESAYG